MDFLLVAEVVLVLVEERVPGLGLVVQLGELGVDPEIGLRLGVGLWVSGLGQQAAPRLWSGWVLERGISSGSVCY